MHPSAPAAKPATRAPSNWLGSLRHQVILALGLLFVLLTGSAGIVYYQLDQRRHDYEILNLAGQLRVTSATLRQQALNYLADTPTDYTTYHRDLNLYYADLTSQMRLFDKIVSAFEARRLDPELTGKSEPLTCNWDARSRAQLALSADDWRAFRKGLLARLGPDESAPRLNWGAEYIAQHGDGLIRSTQQLANAFQSMMEGKLALIQHFNRALLVVAALIMALLVTLLYRNLVRPLREAVSGFERVAKGELGLQVPVRGGTEIRQMARAFNHVSTQLDALFRLTDRINQTNSLDDTLRFVWESFRTTLPVDWVGLLFLSADGKSLVLERHYGRTLQGLETSANLGLGADELARLTQGTGAVHLPDLHGPCSLCPSDLCQRLLHGNRFGSALLLPARGSGESRAILVFASDRPNVFTDDQVELLENVAGQLAHALDKTVFLEALVVAAVQGLAKLAESRDPETGDHLVRMALYSTLVAEELGRDGPYRDLIDPAYVREIHQFAPMHDIGKVGIADGILLKPGKLSQDEFREMQRHPMIGGEVLRRCEAQVNGLGYSIFSVAIEIAECHHERFDGSGYPRGLAGEEIPLSARIIAAADVFDALTSKRPYKEAWPIEQALETLRDESGRHFDPEVVRALLRAMPRIHAVYEQLKHV